MLVQTCLLQADCHKRETALRGKSFDGGCQGAASAAQAACAMFCLVGNRHCITRTDTARQQSTDSACRQPMRYHRPVMTVQAAFKWGAAHLLMTPAMEP